MECVPDIRDTQRIERENAYHNGELAARFWVTFLRTIDTPECPYPKGDPRRKHWFDGFYYTQIDINVGHLLAQRGELW